jgi:hypothetical protein
VAGCLALGQPCPGLAPLGVDLGHFACRHTDQARCLRSLTRAGVGFGCGLWPGCFFWACRFLVFCDGVGHGGTLCEQAIKTITRLVWEESRERMRERRLSPEGRELYKYRKEAIKRSFADAKELHGLRYARMRGRQKVQEQCLLTATAQNIKKIAMVLDRRAKRDQIA